MMCFIWKMIAHKWSHNHFLTSFVNMLSNVRVYSWLKFSFTTSLVIVRVHKIVILAYLNFWLLSTQYFQLTVKVCLLLSDMELYNEVCMLQT